MTTTSGRCGSPGFAAAEAAFDRRHFHRLDPPHPAVLRGLAAKSRRVYEAMWGPNEWTATGRLAGWDVSARLGEPRTPTLVLAGRHDLCTRPIAERLARGIDRAELAVLEHSSHTSVTEESERYLSVVGAFLGRVDADADRPSP